MISQFIYYTHKNSSITTISELLDEEDGIIKGVTKEELLSAEFDVDGNIDSNLKRIYQAYSEEDKIEFESDYQQGRLSKLEVGTILLIPNKDYQNELAAIRGFNLLREDISPKSFIAESLLKLSSDPLYRRANTINTKSNKYTIESLFNECQVWCYIRSINKVIDITPFISSITTGVSVGGGTFSISFAPSSDIRENAYINKNLFNYSNIQVEEKYNHSWYMKNIQMNDIFFIKFERLEVEGGRIKDFDVPKNKIPNQVYDMMGLVDTVEETYNAALNEMTIDVNGRDFTKLIIEDASYFHMLSFIEGAPERFFITDGNVNDNRFFKRTFSDNGQYKYLSLLGYKSIADGLGFIFNQLTNTGANTDNDLFSAYGDRRSKVYNVSKMDKKELEKVNIHGVYQVVDVVIDPDLSDRLSANEGISNPDGNIQGQIFKICQEPFVEFWGDTYADKYVFTARVPPFTRDLVLQYVQNDDISSFDNPEDEPVVIKIAPERVSNFSFAFHTEYYTWFQIEPYNSFIGKGNYASLGTFPAVLVPQFMDIFGNNKMVVQSNYVSYQALKGSVEDSEINLYRQQAAKDLGFMIESSVYLPFTRRGTISIKGGDRRIKRGSWIYFQPTDEYFYVVSVSNSIRTGKNDLDRETVVSVERGMRREFIRGKTVNINDYIDSGKDLPFGESSTTLAPEVSESQLKDSLRDGFTKDTFEVSYFNIMKLDYIQNRLESFAAAGEPNGTLETPVNENVLNFFLYKLQFEEEGIGTEYNTPNIDGDSFLSQFNL